LLENTTPRRDVGVSRTRLLNPGPVTLTERVRGALTREDLCHREVEFAALQLDVRGRLERIYDGVAGTYVAVMLTGSGTAAVEAMDFGAAFSVSLTGGAVVGAAGWLMTAVGGLGLGDDDP
jgi:aspartate aminotransferase-like enzyme